MAIVYISAHAQVLPANTRHCWFNAGPPSATLAQPCIRRCPNVVCCVVDVLVMKMMVISLGYDLT